MTAEADAILAEMRAALRVPYTPEPLARLAEAEGYLAFVWPQIAPSVATAGFLGSARYMADMAIDAVEAVYEPQLTRADLLDAGLSLGDLADLEATVDLFHYAQPQLLLVIAALAEAFDRPQVGGQGRPDARDLTDRERAHLALPARLVPPATQPLPEVAEALGVDAAPDLYRAVAAWPGYLQVAWEELQHLVAYPDFRRRGRALYFYARSGARFLAQPVRANADALRDAGLAPEAIEAAKRTLDAALPATATMMMHAEAMRVGLGIRDREVVTG
ncbi:MAG: halocarboxylic acid dehydrogenase DehI family protein [Dehalococcoidia bacterium]